MADLAAVFAGGMAAGIYPTSSPDACRFIMQDCHANILVVEDDKQLAKFLDFKVRIQVKFFVDSTMIKICKTKPIKIPLMT